jgi:hypothetical protein
MIKIQLFDLVVFHLHILYLSTKVYGGGGYTGFKVLLVCYRRYTILSSVELFCL